MISFLREKNFISVLILCYIATISLVDTAGTLSGDKIIFSPLRRGSNYTLEKAKRDWFLASFDTIAEAVVLSLNSSPPYGKIPLFNLAINPELYTSIESFIDFFNLSRYNVIVQLSIA